MYRGVLTALAACFASAPANATILTFDPGTYTVDFVGPIFTDYKINGDLVITNGDISSGQVNGSIVQFGGLHPYFTTLNAFDAKGSGELRVRAFTESGPIPPPIATFTLTSDYQHFTLTGGSGYAIYIDSDNRFSIDNADIAGVPEPATWAMMIAGFGVAGAAARRRRPLLA